MATTDETAVSKSEEEEARNYLFSSLIIDNINLDIEAYKDAEKIEEKVDAITDRMGENHIIRLNEGTCTPLTGAQYLELANNSERIADHFINVGKTIKALI